MTKETKTVTQLAHIANMTVEEMQSLIHNGIVPPPDVHRYSEASWTKARHAIRKLKQEVQENLLQRAEVAEQLAICVYSLARFVKHGILLPPIHLKIGGIKGYYSQDDVPKLKAQLDEYRKNFVSPGVLGGALATSGKAKRTAKGFFTSLSAAEEYLRIPAITFKSWLRKGDVPYPTRLVDGFMVYNISDLEAIKASKKEYFDKRQAG